MLDRDINQSGAAVDSTRDNRSKDDRSRRRDRLRLKPAFVDTLGDECAHFGPHPPGIRKKDPFLFRYGCLVLQVVFENRASALAWMRALHRLVELHLVAEKYEVSRRWRHPDQI